MMGEQFSDSRDVRCAADVSRMAELGRFDGQFEVFGSAIRRPDGGIDYWAAKDEGRLYHQLFRQRLEGGYPSTIVRLSRRSKVPLGMNEQLLQETQYQLLRQMKAQYEGGYFQLMQPFFEAEPNDSAWPLLKQYAEAIDGHFDDTELQLFDGALWLAFEAKVLTAESYRQLKGWQERIRQQMSGDPIIRETMAVRFMALSTNWLMARVAVA